MSLGRPFTVTDELEVPHTRDLALYTGNLFGPAHKVLAASLVAAWAVDPQTFGLSLPDDTGNGHDLTVSPTTSLAHGTLFSEETSSVGLWSNKVALRDTVGSPLGGSGSFGMMGWCLYNAWNGSNTPQVTFARSKNTTSTTYNDRSFEAYYWPNSSAQSCGFFSGANVQWITSPWTPVQSTWFFQALYYNSVSKEVGYSVNGEPFQTKVLQGAINNDTVSNRFYINRMTSNSWYGRSTYSNVAYYNIPLTNPLVAAMWNNGDGYSLTNDPFNLVGT